MKIGIIGSGGREHALCWFLNKSSEIKEIFCFPGNAGTNQIANNIDINLEDFENLKNFIIDNRIDYIVIGPEKPLVDGMVDYLEKNNIKVFGPNKISSQLEGSKIFTKKLCKKYKIPTAEFGIFFNQNDAINYIKSAKFPIVIKADGLASGKGVYIPNDLNTGIDAINEIFDGKFGKANQILIEEFLNGEEMSYFIVSDGNHYKKFETAQDHKRVLEGDKGKNTGGMGAYSPSRLINTDLDEKINEKIIKPTLKGLKDLGVKYRGFLYAGLMIKDNEPYLIEYNVRMGDPECQTILPRLKTDLFKIIKSCIEENLNEIDIKWAENKSLSIVLCSKGYPEKFKNDVEISNLQSLKINNDMYEFIFHAGTKNINNKIFSNGGRVLNFVKTSKNFKDTRIRIIELIEILNWNNGYFRRDIGHKVIDK